MEEEKTEPPPVVDQANIVLESESLPSGSRGDEGILEGVAITDNLEETYSSESDEGVSPIMITRSCSQLLSSFLCVFVGGRNYYSRW